MQTLELRDGTSIPAFGLGTWLSDKGTVYAAVRKALEVGYRHVDCAWIYQNEQEIGGAFKDAIAAGDVRREDLWVTSKLWNDMHAAQDVRPALERTLALLGLDYLDLYLMHWPVAVQKGVQVPRDPSEFIALDDLPLAVTWQAMGELVTAELTRQVGVSNCSARQISTISQAVGLTPAVNQIELHPYLQQDALLSFMREQKIVATAYAPMGSSGRPPGLRRKGETPLLEDAVILAIAAQHDVGPGAVLIAWALNRGTSAIPKSTRLDRIVDNFAASTLRLSDSDMERIAALDAAARYVTGTFWCGPGSPYSLETLWG